MPNKILSMNIEEVSAVDKAATGKKFLIIKHLDEGGESMTYEELIEKIDDEELQKAVDAIVEDKENTITDLEKKIEALKVDEDPEGEKGEDINKSELPEEIRKKLEEMEDAVDKANKKVEIEKKRRLEVEFTKKAQKFDKVGDVEKTAKVLMKAKETFEEDTYEDLENLLKSAQERIDAANIDDITGEKGEDANDPLKKLEDKAEEISKRDDVSKEKAFTKALEQYPELYREYIENE